MCELDSFAANCSKQIIGKPALSLRQVEMKKYIFEGVDVGKNGHRENSITQITAARG
ncbi:hypothetical protein WP9W18E04_23580 [Aeromonas veronii]|nr:hypothetical protein WP9W18E04_23580 [Aeromonas veronii]